MAKKKGFNASSLGGLPPEKPLQSSKRNEKTHVRHGFYIRKDLLEKIKRKHYYDQGIDSDNAALEEVLEMYFERFRYDDPIPEKPQRPKWPD